jgi:hypothetical protein
MINLIPPQLKQELKYARWNAIIVKYLVVVVLLVLFVGGGFTATSYYLDQRVVKIKEDIASKKARAEGYKSTIEASKSLNDRVSAIKTIQASQPKFSLLLSDIAKFTLKGTSISSISLTGADNKPVQITASAVSYNAAVSLRDALASSPRVSGADIVSVVNNTQANNYTAVIVIGFKPGQAR